MRYTDATSIKAALNIIGQESGLACGGIFSLFRGGRGKKLTKAQKKKLARMRYRMFVDNIVMHHKRLHDRNRETTINLAKLRMQGQKSKEPAKSNPESQTLSVDSSRSRKNSMEKQSPTKWRDRFDKRARILTIRGRIDVRRLRARSRWLSIVSHDVDDDRDHSAEIS